MERVASADQTSANGQIKSSTKKIQPAKKSLKDL